MICLALCIVYHVPEASVEKTGSPELGCQAVTGLVRVTGSLGGCPGGAVGPWPRPSFSHIAF